ncbi:hypothetical protein HDG40_000784 [Paraburkholderia sp. JPY158]|uniref:Uncharacterized protein n=1 Tax=Paraburkholderia atlantica TaxID=2654982 RepID=A0A7W8Q3G0_PARAM|nr:hypothetical protein [Paraburkholderia atlantica]MBB5422643.1 hypothetical protein [Paraburkholderia atlantica]
MPSPLVERAMGAVAHLIDRFASSLDFYWDIRMSVLEQWMLESYPEVVENLQSNGMYADFAARLDADREELVNAAATVSAILKYGFDDILEHDLDRHLVLSRLSSRIWSRDVQHLDRATALVSSLLDKHTPSDRIPHYCSLLEAAAKHATIQLRDESWGWCDILEAKTASLDVAHLITREHFPCNAAAYTNEEYALVVRLPEGTDLPSLVAPNFVSSVNIRAGDGPAERSIVFSGLPFRIPMVANEQTLRRFRNFLPVLYLHDEGSLLVEYPWTPVTDFVRCLYPSIDMDMPPELDEESDELQDFQAAHPHTARISEIRPMPLKEGPYISQRQRSRLNWDLAEISF